MQISVTIPVIILAVVISQGLFAAVVLGFQRRNRQSNIFLSLLLLFVSLWLVDALFEAAGVYHQDPDFYFKPIYYSFAFGPLIYFYVRSLTNAQFRFQPRHFLHFIPVLIQGLLYWFLTFQSYDFKRWYWTDVHSPVTYILEFDGTLLSMVIYLVLSILLLKRYQNWLKDQFSEFSRVRLNWLKLILFIILILCVQWLVEVILRDFFNSYTEYNYSPMILGVLAVLLAYGGIRQSNLAHILFSEKQPDVPEKNVEIDELILKKILERMKIERDYLNPTLSLKEFAAALNLPPRVISQHINIGIGKTFVDFVNEYRIAEVKRKLTSEDRKTFTLLAIAYDSGFNSKSSFNRIFKKFTGTSPSEYSGE